MIPFATEVSVNAHQIPSSPKDVRLKTIANGIRIEVAVILITLHNFVLPSPSWKNTPAIGPGKRINASMIKAPQMATVQKEIR